MWCEVSQALYIRSSYIELYDLLMKNRRESIKRKENLFWWHMNGDPGIGKRFFLAYLLVRLLLDPQNLSNPDFKIILISGRDAQPKAFVYTHGSGWYDVISVKEALRLGLEVDRHSWLLLDVYTFPKKQLCQSVFSVAPPQYNYYQLFESTGAAVRYLPAWTLEELQDAFAKMVKAGLPPPSQRPVNAETISADFKEFGGRPQTVYRLEPYQLPMSDIVDRYFTEQQRGRARATAAAEARPPLSIRPQAWWGRDA